MTRQDIVDKCFPQRKKKKRVRDKDIPYMTTTLSKNAIRTKRKAFKKSGSKCRKIKSRGKLMLKASHWSRYVKGTLVNMKNVVGNLVTRTGTIHGGLKHVSYNISMETRLHLKSSLFPLICQYFITKL